MGVPKKKVMLENNSVSFLKIYFLDIFVVRTTFPSTIQQGWLIWFQKDIYLLQINCLYYIIYLYLKKEIVSPEEVDSELLPHFTTQQSAICDILIRMSGWQTGVHRNDVSGQGVPELPYRGQKLTQSGQQSANNGTKRWPNLPQSMRSRHFSEIVVASVAIITLSWLTDTIFCHEKTNQREMSHGCCNLMSLYLVIHTAVEFLVQSMSRWSRISLPFLFPWQESKWVPYFMLRYWLWRCHHFFPTAACVRNHSSLASSAPSYWLPSTTAAWRLLFVTEVSKITNHNSNSSFQLTSWTNIFVKLITALTGKGVSVI